MYTLSYMPLNPSTTFESFSNFGKCSLMLKLLTIIWMLIIPSLIIMATSTSAALSRMNSEVITDNIGVDVSEMLLVSNLSCFVCTTIDDINCKYLNETINRIHRQQQKEIGGNTGNDDNSMMGFDSDTSGYLNHDHHHHNPNHNHYTLESILSSDSSSYDVLATASSSNDGHTTTNNAGHKNPNLMNEFRADCTPNEQYCVVIRLGVSAPDNVQEFNFFALKRGCAEQCTDGCFIIGNGEKTKLSICASCCRSNYCNLGNSAITFNHHSSQWFSTIIIISLLLLMMI